ncbi:WLM-domain-containing protein [Coniochaeta ligniaria NRRL 30616]|uniref:WLM-domain-containing protein n=1 Tax=Coniochaeta ligniaria NRRL 30616 TaxID=1408157 RepID=A0A1J7J5P6_9PEZI|nr:WLM-domain-containing protein [Coniochaeta ligniaria NRRL 30616]
MPLGIQRINAKKSHPNDRIIFIKPLKGPDEKIAQDFLERIAAQCVPIMREHHLSVTTLEEYEPNREFVGRNFNAGEVVQLVLKTRSGHWLPFNYVQMVMMHELAHCKQMNHSRAFWAVRNSYAEQMRLLWTRSYTGEGIWGRGALLGSGAWERDTAPADEPLPEHLCGGTYRSRGRKRKPKVSYKEQKERRIRKKFGVNGAVLGEDEEVKRKLEGKSVAAKPRVAGSARGRELRAAAALARFETVKKEEIKKEKEVVVIDEDDIETASEAETESGDEEGDAREVDGRKILDGKGHRMVKVCEDENPEDADARNELSELKDWFSGGPGGKKAQEAPKNKSEAGTSGSSGVKKEAAGQRSIMDMLGAKKDVKKP